MFKVVFTKKIYDEDSLKASNEYALLSREEQLPFMPTTGIYIHWDIENSHAPIKVEWNANEKYVLCTMEDEFPNKLEMDYFNFDYLIDQAVKAGWHLVKKESFIK